MDYIKTNLKWTDHFTKEALELEEKMSDFDIEELNKSKIRLSIEKKILDWNKYESWAVENFSCASFKNDMLSSSLKKLIPYSEQAFDIYSSHNKLWSEDLLPLLVWDNQLVVIGIHFNENLLKIENHIFILAPPEVLSFFAKTLLNQISQNVDDESEISVTKLISEIEGLDLNIKPPSLGFRELFENTATSAAAIESTQIPTSNDPATAALKIKKSENSIWDFINQRHDEYVSEIKKQFGAYIVLKINYDMTRVYKMDPDLENQSVNHQLFSYSLKQENPFKRVYESGEYESFNLSQLGLNFKNYKYACISALKHENKVVGFLVGFKDVNLSVIDQLLLEDLAREATAA